MVKGNYAHRKCNCIALNAGKIKDDPNGPVELIASLNLHAKANTCQ